MTTFVDITEFMEDATGELDSGELLFMPNFALFDAMSAIEIMDPRMDSALVPPGVTPPEVPFTDPNAPLLAEEVCWVLDRTLAAEMGWHSGYALSQTLYTSLYMHNIQHDMNVPHYYPSWRYDPARPIALVSIVLQAGMMAIVKTCDMVWRELSKGYVYDLEDFNADKSEVSLLEGVQIPTVLRQLDKALAWLERWQTTDTEWQKALYHRIALRKHILLAVSTNEATSLEPFQRSTHVLDALASFHSVRAGPVPADPPASSQLHAAFDPTINRRLIVNMPLKVIQLMTMADAWKSLQSMLEGMLEACRMIESTNILDIMMLLKLRARQPSAPNRSAYIRSLNTSLLLHKYSPHNSRKTQQSTPLEQSPVHLFFSQLVGVPLDRLRALRYWPGGGLPVDPTYLEDTIERCITRHLLSLCYNRPRMRRSMSKTLASWHEIWEDTVDVAVKVRNDPELKDLKRLPLGIRHLRLVNLAELMFAGFETSLYARGEWPIMYWQLARVLNLQIQTMEMVSRLLHEEAGSHSSSELYARSYITYSKALRSLCHGTLLTLFARPPKDLDISKLSEPATSNELLLLQRRFKWAFGSHAKRLRYADDARPDFKQWIECASTLESRKNEETAREALKEFKEARVYLLNLIDQSVWKVAGGAGNQLMTEFLTSCVKLDI
ncbi:Mak10 subunit, NatC N(alpha)-terminal acetyltransferase [Ceratobasidium sp. AG-Ba]|nr:Mak10 subunit, NatC N(alpha)-terminal acetyltransferase [Ceratobasidium sp. AG-Ba]